MYLEELRILVIVLSTILAIYTDLKHGLIYNKVTFPLFFSGLFFKFYVGGIAYALDGIAAGIIISLLTFIMSSPGGGDIKLALGIGVWIGFEGFYIYMFGSILVRVILSLIIKLKIYGIKDFLQGVKLELRFFISPELGDKNFKIFQNAGRKAGYLGNQPVVPGALWVAGGVFSYVAAFLIIV